MILCTLFNTNYLERALVLYHSLKRYTNDFTLYIFLLDDTSYRTIIRMNLENVVAIPEKELLKNSQLKKAKKERTNTEYCWTVTPYIIEYVLDEFNENNCTYIDADMCFFSNPNEIFDEILQSKCDVSIIGHRFPKNFEKTRERMSGRYCVECNTFFNNEKGREVLSWWLEKCTEACTMNRYENGFGDQKYLSDWPSRFSNIHEISNLGCGVAPWNISDYSLHRHEKGQIVLLYKKKEICNLIFYHFQNITFTGDRVNIGVYSEVGSLDNSLVKLLYMNYLRELLFVRKKLEKDYNIKYTVQEPRKGKGHWKYIDLNDLLYHLLSLLSIFLHYKKNRLNLSDIYTEKE